MSNLGIESVGFAGQELHLSRFLYEEVIKFYVFSAHKIFTTFCASFPNRISHFKIMAMP